MTPPSVIGSGRVPQKWEPLLRSELASETGCEFFSLARYRASGKRTRALSLGWSLYGQPTLTFDAIQGRVICGQAIIKDVDADYAPTLDLSEQ